MNQVTIAPNQSGSFALTANQLKLIAIVCMAIDHIAHAFVPGDTMLYFVMRFLGRITGPTMFFLAAAGYQYTRNVNKYMLRLALFALISYIPFNYCFYGYIIPSTISEALSFGVIYTIFLGVAAIRVRRSELPILIKVLLIVVIYLLSYFGDWGSQCISMMLLFDLFQGDFKKQFWGYLAIIFLLAGLLSYLSYPLYYLLDGSPIDWSFLPYLVITLGMIVPIFLLSRYNGEKGKGGAVAKYGFYIFYPLHLLIIGVISHVILA